MKCGLLRQCQTCDNATHVTTPLHVTTWDDALARHLNLSIPTPTFRHKSISNSEKQWHYYSTICKVTKHTTSHTAYRIKLHATTLKLEYYS